MEKFFVYEEKFLVGLPPGQYDGMRGVKNDPKLRDVIYGQPQRKLSKKFGSELTL